MNAISHIEISHETYEKLEFFKRIVDAIVEEKLSFKDYVELVLSRGIASMLRDVIPKDVDILLRGLRNFW